MEQLWAQFDAFAKPLEKEILEWVDPSGRYAISPTKDWPATDFSVALAVALGYLAFVMIGTVGF